MLVGLTLEGTGDVGGQKTLRSYWRNYFEKTDALIWVVDSTDRLRIQDCRDELKGLLQEEVSTGFGLRLAGERCVLMGRVAPGGCESACVCKQDGCGGVYERGGDTLGESSHSTSIYSPGHHLADW